MARRFVRRAEERVSTANWMSLCAALSSVVPAEAWRKPGPIPRNLSVAFGGRRSSQNETLGSGSALAVARLSGTTWRDFAKGAETKIRILATAFARALHVHHPQKCRGRREGRVLAAPADPRAKRLRESAKTTGTGGITPAFPCAVVYGLLRALPGEPAFATVIFAMPLELCDNLAPA
jgi:hypothetical protein